MAAGIALATGADVAVMWSAIEIEPIMTAMMHGIKYLGNMVKGVGRVSFFANVEKFYL